MNLKSISLLLSLIPLSAAQFQCGANISTISNAPISGNDPTTVSLSKTAPDVLCLLVRITARSNTADLNAISNTSKLADYTLVPIARSYEGGDWLKSAGPYAQDLVISCPTSSSSCDLQIPILPKLQEGRFVLMPYQYSLDDDRARVSRFFHQTTFGPTLSMINEWNYSAESLEQEMARWVKDQMNPQVTPITSHREYLRRRFNGELESYEENPDGSRKQMFRARNPCDAGARWVLHSFSSEDKGEELVVSQRPDGTWSLEVGGVLRTVMKEWRDSFYNELYPGTYYINWDIDEKVGGRFGVNIDNQWMNIYGGNPPVNVPMDSSNVKMMTLPPFQDFSRTPIINYESDYYDDTLYVTTAITGSNVCDNFDVTDSTNIIGTFSVPFNTDSPTSSPTTFPTQYNPPLTAVNVGNPCGNFFESGLCEMCTGDCDDDEDCAGDMVCGQRDPWEDAPPGCTFEGAEEGLIGSYVDFCYLPLKGHLSYIGECHPSGICGMCQGDCDSDADCEEGMMCFQRWWTEEVPGCLGAGNVVDRPGSDICIPSPYRNYQYTQARYARYIELKENTLESPLPNGASGIEACSNPIMDWNNEQSCSISTSPDACQTNRYETLPAGSAILVCGSPNEVANDPFGQNIFQVGYTSRLKDDDEFEDQKKSSWTMIALSAMDQLRQRVAWALSQILVITPNQIEDTEFSEMYLNYYDIFVKNAFANYFDVLKEVSYSPMMGEMLGFVGSKSMPFVLKDKGIYAFPDENFAREIMQLFSIGIHKMNMDGTLQLDDQGFPIQTYSAEDIQTFAKGWTGFTHAPRRSNVEAYYWDMGNRIDPMIINGPWRDHSPKLDLNRGYIGDRYPLCSDLPQHHFLRTGASYRLLGSSKYALWHSQADWWFTNDEIITALDLTSTSQLYDKLCSASVEGGSCNFAPLVTLDSNLSCDSTECDVDDLRLVKVQTNPDVYYEYVRLPCVEHTFYPNSRTVQLVWPYEAMCANADLPLATDMCCQYPTWGYTGGDSFCKYSFEKVKFATSESRCTSTYEAGGQCTWVWQNNVPEECSFGENDVYFWASPKHCKLQAKISRSGMVALVHNPVVNPFTSYKTDINVDMDNLNFFQVAWTDRQSYPNASNSCGNMNDCVLHTNGEDCICDIALTEELVFSSLPSASEAISQLFVGGININISDEYTQLESSTDVKVFQKLNGGYNTDTIFEVQYFGEPLFLKNIRSNVVIGDYSFRNPVQFLNPALHEARDAHHESEAILKHYIQHPNVAPFLAQRLIKRFGISNPSPLYIESVANAFKTGSFAAHGQIFGDSRYGSLEATVAAIVLHDESRNELLDADPTSGSLREPLIKLISFLRSMQFETKHFNPEPRLSGLDQKIGQEAYAIPNVFSYFLPEYAPSGHIDDASITAPEAQVLNGPKLTAFVNGLFSLVQFGLNSCFGGFGDRTTSSCSRLLDGTYNISDFQRGSLNYTPSDSTSPSSVVEELALLLTGGRLSQVNKLILQDAYANLGGLSAVQKLITVVPEFHATGVVEDTSILRSDAVAPGTSAERYKAIVILNLSGGADSFNILVPLSECVGKDMYDEYSTVRSGLAIEKSSLLQIDATNSNQICNKFGIHPYLGVLQSLYNDGDLTFISNIGVLQEYATKENWRSKTDDTVLFAHNTQTSEVQNVDIFEAQAGRGVGGRILDVLNGNGYHTNAVSARDAAEALASRVTPLIVVPSLYDYDKFDPMSAESSEPDIFINKVKELNSDSNLGSNLFTETYSSKLIRGLSENNLLYNALRSTSLNITFPDHSIGEQFETVATMIKTKEVRGVERDVYFVEHGGYDLHSNLQINFNDRASQLNESIEAFVDEIKIQGLWNDVTVVVVTEFARTLTENTGSGSDHAWGGNMFVFGGDIDGGKILGEYPDDLTTDGPLIVNPRGIVLPTTSYDALWNGVAQWFGVTNDADLDVVLPNRHTFSLFDTMTLYGYSTTANPTISNAPTQSPVPTMSPTYSVEPSSAPSLNESRVIDFAWYIPAAPGYRTQTVLLGDTVRFTFSSFHNVYRSPTGSCPEPGTNQEAYKIGDDHVNGVLFTFSQVGEITFYCAAGNGSHCAAGQIVKFNVILPQDASSAPSSSPTMNNIIKYAGNPCNGLGGGKGNCIACTGDCDRDSDCLGDLRCAQRSRWDGLEEVPGCTFLSGDPFKTTNDDFCFQPLVVEPGIANYVGECSAETYLCGECEGDCDSDSDCQEGLICQNRSGLQSVGGCTGGLPSDVYGKDICVRPPTISPAPSSIPTPSPSATSAKPSSSPSPSPTLLPSASPSKLQSLSPTFTQTMWPSASPTKSILAIVHSFSKLELSVTCPFNSTAVEQSISSQLVSSLQQNGVTVEVLVTILGEVSCSGRRHLQSQNVDALIETQVFIRDESLTYTDETIVNAAASLSDGSFAVTNVFAIGQPSAAPSMSPSSRPSANPTSIPTSRPSSSPSVGPTMKPSASPSDVPTRNPSISPSEVPTSVPSSRPTKKPSISPTNRPSSTPSVSPTRKPSASPSNVPTRTPSKSPTKSPVPPPTAAPTSFPTPASYKLCRTVNANKKINNCIKIPGCYWCSTCSVASGKCRPKTPAPTASPSSKPTRSPSEAPSVSIVATVSKAVKVELDVTCPFDQSNVGNQLTSEVSTAIELDGANVQVTLLSLTDTSCSDRRVLQSSQVEAVIEVVVAIRDSSVVDTYTNDFIESAINGVSSETFSVASSDFIAMPSAVPSASPTSRPTRLTAAPTASPTTGSTPSVWLRCRTVNAMKKRNNCIKISGCIWINNSCYHVNSRGTGNIGAPVSVPVSAPVSPPTGSNSCSSISNKNICKANSSCAWKNNKCISK